MVTELQAIGITEQELRQGCIDGRRDYQEMLYRYFSPKMFGICLRYASDYHHAEDILQEGFIKIFNNMDKFRGDGSFEGWIKRIFINTAIEHYRKSNVHNGHADIDTHNNVRHIGEKATGSLATQDLMKMVQKLSPGYRTIFNLYVIEGYSHKEISNMMGISEGTSKSQLARARSILQKLVKSQIL
jgi:RNA polymerase sigma-70 factor (ECF subfamily)